MIPKDERREKNWNSNCLRRGVGVSGFAAYLGHIQDVPSVGGISMKKLVSFCAVFIAALLCDILIAPGASGQAAYGNIIGAVTDPSGAAVPGAKVTATDIAKGVTYTATANPDGYYALNNLTPGNYKVVVEA